jgi:hypothetical protein
MVENGPEPSKTISVLGESHLVKFKTINICFHLVSFGTIILQHLDQKK